MTLGIFDRDAEETIIDAGTYEDISTEHKYVVSFDNQEDCCRILTRMFQTSYNMMHKRMYQTSFGLSSCTTRHKVLHKAVNN